MAQPDREIGFAEFLERMVLRDDPDERKAHDEALEKPGAQPEHERCGHVREPELNHPKRIKRRESDRRNGVERGADLPGVVAPFGDETTERNNHAALSPIRTAEEA